MWRCLCNPGSPLCRELLRACEGLQKQGWQVNTAEEMTAEENKPQEVSMTISQLLNMELYSLPMDFLPGKCTLVQEIPYDFCQCAVAGRS